jgi:hypothetical protein
VHPPPILSVEVGLDAFEENIEIFFVTLVDPHFGQSGVGSE